jgi:hypothetical protein
MIYKKLAALTAATVIGAALMAAPAQARFGGFGGMHGGGGFAGGHVGGFGGMHGGGGFAVGHVGGFGGFRGGFVGHPGFVGRTAFVNHGFFPGHRVGFFPHRRFIGPFVGVGALYGAGYYGAGYSSCWTWVPTYYGWRRAWTCDYGYGYDY